MGSVEAGEAPRAKNALPRFHQSEDKRGRTPGAGGLAQQVVRQRGWQGERGCQHRLRTGFSHASTDSLGETASTGGGYAAGNQRAPASLVHTRAVEIATGTITASSIMAHVPHVV